MTAQRSVLVTGGAGFIGSHLTARLLGRGWRVRILDNFYRPDETRMAELVADDRVEIVEGDVRYRAVVDRAIHGVDAVVHLAALAINKSVASPSESLDVNLMGTYHVAESACTAGVSRFVFASSASVYGDPKSLPMRETDATDPQTPYCIAKLAGEQLLAFLGASRGLSWTALRFFNVYGPGQRTDAYYTSVVLTFLRRIARGQAPVIDGDGQQSMDFVHVDDVAHALVLALESDVGGAVLNVGTGSSTTIRELAHLMIDHLGVAVEPVFRPRAVLVTRRAADISHIREVLGWEPAIDVVRGLRTVVDAFKADAERP
jgi:UDP-glucose 4-epimerase